MLAVIRHKACRALPQCFPRYARPFLTATATDREGGEAMNALGLSMQNLPTDTPARATGTEREEAMNALGLSTQDLPTDTAARPPVMPPPVDLANMHHHIPPASSPLLQFMTTLVMKHGEYAKAAKTVSRMLLHIYSLTRSPPMPVVEKAVEIASPAVKNKKLKQGGGKTMYVPQALNERQRTRRGIKWIISESGKKGKPGKTYAERLARQVIATVGGHEGTNKFKEEIHRLAMVNRGVLPKR